MSKVKYYYDSETLSYRKIEKKKGRKRKFTIFFVLGSLLSGFLFFLIYINFPQIETPKEKALKRELHFLKLQYQVLNKKMNMAEKALADVQHRDNSLYRVYFEADPIPQEKRQAGFGGVNRYRDMKGYESSELVINTAKRLDVLMKQIVVQSKSLDKIVELAKEKEKLLTAIPAVMPIENKYLEHIASGYGMRWHPILKIMRMHDGMDFAAPLGTPVYATGDAVVEDASRHGGYGNRVVLDHGFGYKTYYAHLQGFEVYEGEHVERGEIIGYLGNTGLSTGPHVHYEVHKNGKTVNPAYFYYGDLNSHEYEIMLEQAQMQNQSMD